MSENNEKQTPPRGTWLLPDEWPPLRGRKIQLLTVGGIQTNGFWNDEDCVCWQKLNDTPALAKKRMCEWAKGNKNWRNEQ